MNRTGGNLRTGQLLGYLVRSVLGPGEDQHGAQIVVLKKVLEEMNLLGLGNFVNDLFNGVRRIRTPSDLHLSRLELKLLGELFDRAGKSRREKQGLSAFLGQILDDPADVGEEAHVQHSVGFIKHQIFKTRKIGATLVHQVHQATGSRYHQFVPIEQSLFLRTLPTPP